MNNYYFTESKWYGPLPESLIKPDCFKGDASDEDCPECWPFVKNCMALPSGDSLIPEFAGMVKEENKDFVFEIVETKLVYRKTAVKVAEEGKQTFSEEKNQRRYPLPKLIKSLAYATEHISPGKKFVEFAETATEAEKWLHNELANAFVAGWEAKTKYLKTKQ